MTKAKTQNGATIDAAPPAQLDEAFAPIVGSNPKVLILGSMPGIKSINEQQYYAHPQNAFWFIIGSLLTDQKLETYSQCLQCLRDNGIALWDVAARCEREGSLDSNIVNESFEPNDFACFLAEHSSIECVFFNGLSVDKLFRRHVLNKRGIGNYRGDFRTLPSTSPANARLSKHEKLSKWRCLLDYLKD